MSQYVATLQSYLPKSEPFRSITTTLALGAATVVTAKAVFAVKNAISSSRRTATAKARRAEQKKDTVYLFGFPRTPDGGQLSIFVDRVESYLKLKNIPYKYVDTMDANISDTGRLPCAELNGSHLTDSKFIIDHLETTFNKGDNLSAEQQSKLTTLFSLTEYIRWHHYRATMIDNPNYTIDTYAGFVSYPRFILKKYVMSMRKGMIKTWNDAGHGDLSDAQYNQQYLEDVKALDFYCEQANKNNKFLLGTDKATKGDTLIAPWLRNIRRAEKLAGVCPAFAFACSSENMKEYLKRFDTALQQ